MYSFLQFRRLYLDDFGGLEEAGSVEPTIDYVDLSR